jgi:hypothetical protein
MAQPAEPRRYSTELALFSLCNMLGSLVARSAYAGPRDALGFSHMQYAATGVVLSICAGSMHHGSDTASI